MRKVGVIGVGQSSFVRGYPGSIRELAFEGFRDAMSLGSGYICILIIIYTAYTTYTPMRPPAAWHQIS